MVVLAHPTSSGYGCDGVLIVVLSLSLCTPCLPGIPLFGHCCHALAVHLFSPYKQLLTVVVLCAEVVVVVIPLLVLALFPCHCPALISPLAPSFSSRNPCCEQLLMAMVGVLL